MIKSSQDRIAYVDCDSIDLLRSADQLRKENASICDLSI